MSSHILRTHFIRRANLKPEKAKQKNYKKKVVKNGMAVVVLEGIARVVSR